MKGTWKRVITLVAAVMLLGSLCLGLIGCGNSGDSTISVYVFCSDAEKVTYQDIIDAWAKEYGAKLHAKDPNKFGEGYKVEVKFDNEPTETTYFQNLNKQLKSGNAADIVYVSPSSVQSYVKKGYVLDLTEYIDYSKYDISDLWGDALGRYSYNSKDGSIGLPVEYKDGAFYQNGDTSKKVGVYALPKDYSSFSYVYNANFFKEELTNKYENTVDKFGAVYEYDETRKPGEKPWESSSAKPANIISIGKTVTYYPFNFYNYYTLKDAYAAGDPVAVLSVKNGGYDITLPGYPNQTYNTGIKDDPATAYDESVGYMVYTYSEFSAVSFAVSYYITAYDSQRTGTSGAVKDEDYTDFKSRYQTATWLNKNNVHGVYANDQYDRETFYLTSWLAGNDVSIISDDYKTITAPKGQESTSDYGMNSTKFIEAFSAFSAYSSDWLGNMYFSKSKLDSAITGQGGYTGLTQGFNVFYGYGTWDTSKLDTDKSVLDYQVMPTPVNDDYSLYTRYKDMNYKSAKAGEHDKGGDYSADIQKSLNARQDKWAARMDSVGFGVNSKVTSRYKGDNEWKREAVVDLCAYLTIDPETQVSLTYAGSQIPNYMSQGEDYLNAAGDFENMISPDSAEWSKYYPVALEISKQTGALQKNKKVSDWMKDKGYQDLVASINPLYANATFGNVNGSLSYAFRMFNMTSLNKNSRNLLIRMASKNGVADPCTYTYNNTWWKETFMTYEGYYLFAFNLEEKGYDSFTDKKLTASDLQTSKFTPNTPYNYIMALYQIGEAKLQESLMQGA